MEKAISAMPCTSNYMPLIGASIHCELEMEKKIYKLGKVDDRIPVLQLTRSRSKKQKEPDI